MVTAAVAAGLYVIGIPSVPGVELSQADLIASSLPGPALDALRARGWSGHALPPADEAERGQMIGAFFNEFAVVA